MRPNVINFVEQQAIVTPTYKIPKSKLPRFMMRTLYKLLDFLEKFDDRDYVKDIKHTIHVFDSREVTKHIFIHYEAAYKATGIPPKTVYLGARQYYDFEHSDAFMTGLARFNAKFDIHTNEIRFADMEVVILPYMDGILCV